MLEGKGFYIWKLHNVEGGDPVAILRRAQNAGLSHVLIKIADGPRAYNVDLAQPVVEVLKAAGIAVWGWQFVYGDEPFGEADIAVHRIRVLGLDGFVVNAEEAYKKKYRAAMAYMESLRPRVGGIPIALSSFRYPHYHPEFPWTEFLSFCDINMPQVYWVQAHDPAAQINRCIQQFQEVYPVRPIIPTGPAYEEYGWRPTPAEIDEFLRHARDIGLKAANFWSWDYAGSPEGADFWHAVASFHWPVTQKPVDILDALYGAINRGDVNAVVALYQPNGVLVTPQKLYAGHDAIREYYMNLLKNELPGASFVYQTVHDEGYFRNVQWSAQGASTGKQVTDSYDTVGLRQGLIQYHSSIYKIELA